MPELLSSPKMSPIASRCVLLVEGNDEQGFFEALARHMNLQIGKDIEFRQVRGKNNYKSQFRAFLNDPGFNNVRAYGLIRDADENAQNALTSLQDILRDARQPCPGSHAVCIYDSDKNVKVGVFIVSGYGMTKGMLEDLCLQSVQDHPVMSFVEEYIHNVKQKRASEAPKNESKARVQTFLAGMKETVPHLGVAAGKGYWNLASPALDEIRAFVDELTR